MGNFFRQEQLGYKSRRRNLLEVLLSTQWAEQIHTHSSKCLKTADDCNGMHRPQQVLHARASITRRAVSCASQ